MIIPAADEAPSNWKYTYDNPERNWYRTNFDDADWVSGPAPFGSKKDSKHAKTDWTTPDIWLRRTVNLETDISEPVLKMLYDEDFEIYLNGQLWYEKTGYNNEYQYLRLDPLLGQSFQKGPNTLAIHCKNTSGRQHIDIGIGEVSSFEADQVLTLNTVPQKMAYDKTELNVMAGQFLEIVLNNKDEMPHNLVLIEKGSLEAFGKIVDQFLTSPDAAEKNYLPDSRYILGATKMLDPGESDRVQLKVPDLPGRYPFICTFPGHWRIMQGVLNVLPAGSYPAVEANAPQIVAMGGGGSNDFLKYFGIADGKILHQNGQNAFHFTENVTTLHQLLDQADILFLTNNKPLNEAVKTKIFDRVNDGMPLLISHPSTWYNWKDWPEYNRQLVGGGSNSHEALQEFEVEVIRPYHPIMKDVPRTFRITDELYRWEQDPEGTPIEVLAVGNGLESGDVFPVVWIVRHPKTRIVCNTLGHDNDAHSLPAYQTILNNSLNWVKKGLAPKLME